MHTLKTEPDLCNSVLKAQLDKLIVAPLLAASDMPSPVVIVFDALDECDGSESVERMLHLLADAMPKLSQHLRPRLLITSRPDPHIRSRFHSPDMLAVAQVTALHDIDEVIVEGDIRRYLHHRLNNAATDEEVDLLTKMAKGLFIFASTASDFILDKFWNDPKGQLKVVLAGEVTGDDGPYGELDRLYLQVLSSALPPRPPRRLVERLRTVLAAITLLFDPSTPRTLDHFLQLNNGSVTQTLQRLQAVVVVPQDDAAPTPIRLIHPSFPDFLSSSVRCGDDRFFIDGGAHHSRLAELCFDHLSSLRRDPCAIGRRPIPNVEVTDLDTRLSSAAPSHVRYACLHWASHLSRASLRRESLLAALTSFCDTKLLYWVEMLSLMNRLEAALPLLKAAERFANVRPFRRPEQNFTN